MKLWAGRFQKETDTLVNDFNSSIQFDARLYKQDIAGSIAHAQMLGKQGIVEEHEVEQIVEGLKAILADIEADKVEFSVDNEDIHMNIETLLTQRIGDAGKRLHTARSRNDQVAVDTRLYVKEEIPVIIGKILDLEQVLVEKAKEHTDTVMPGYTHLQRAQPTTFGHYMMAYANMFKRDVTRLEDCMERLDECPLGAGALATTTYNIDRFATAQADGLAALLIQRGHQALIHLAAQHLLHDVQRFVVDTGVTILVLQLHAGLLQGLLRLRADAVDQHHLDAHQAQHDDVRHHCLPQLRVGHRHAAAVDHHDLSIILLDVRQGFGKHFRTIQIRIHLHFLPLPVSYTHLTLPTICSV